MDRRNLQTWTRLTKDGSIRCLKYSWGPATANALAVKLDDASWIVVSPPSGAPSPVFDDLAKDGPIRALVAPNAYHYLGQAEWRLRFPGASSYAPDGALLRLKQKSREVEYRPIEELVDMLPSRVSVVAPAGTKTPDVLIRASSGVDTVWWMGELFSNATKDDQIWPLRLLARLVGSGLGYRRNSKPGLVYVDDPVVWLRSVREAVEAALPSIVVPAHGDPVTNDTARRTQALLLGA